MFETQNFIAFLAASILIILAPGPAQALVLARTIGSGRKSGIMTAIGLNVGTLFHAVAAGLGLSAVLATSALAFSVVKLAGAGYLVYLGVRAVLTRPTAITETEPLAERSDHSFLKAVVTGVLNPKVALFFLAFLPQFVDPGRGGVLAQFLVLGATMAVLDTLYELALVAVFARLRGRYLANPRVARWQARISGVVLIALGVRLAVQDR